MKKLITSVIAVSLFTLLSACSTTKVSNQDVLALRPTVSPGRKSR